MTNPNLYGILFKMERITFRKKKHGDGSGEKHIYYLLVNGKKTNYCIIAFNVAIAHDEIECRIRYPRVGSKPRMVWYDTVEEAKKALVQIYNEQVDIP